MSNRFQSNFNELAETIKAKALSQNELDDVLRWGEVYGRLMYTNHSGVYRDDELENHLIARFGDCLKVTREPTKEELHVITEAYDTGGHTRLLERIAEKRDGTDVLVSKGGNSEKFLRISNDCRIHSQQTGFSLSELVEKFSTYKFVYLHLHPNDLLSFFAAYIVKRAKKTKVVLVNHADHVFTFGFKCVDEVAEVSLYGLKLNDEKRSIESGFIGIPLNNPRYSKIESKNTGSGIKILTGATSLKYEPSDSLSFPDFAIELLNRLQESKLTVIGPNLVKDVWWWKALIKCRGKIKIYKKLPYEKYISELEGVDLYIDSFPMTGGTALPEVRAKGIPVTGIGSGSSGYTPYDQTKFRSLEDLISAIAEFEVSPDSSKILGSNNNANLMELASSIHDAKNVGDNLHDLAAKGVKKKAYIENDMIDLDFYHKPWLTKKKIAFGKQVYTFLFENFASGGKQVLEVFLRNQNPMVKFKFWILRMKY